MNWKPLIKKEWLSLRHKEDMLTLRQGREWAGFDGFIENMLTKFDCKLLRVSEVSPQNTSLVADMGLACSGYSSHVSCPRKQRTNTSTTTTLKESNRLSPL